MKHIGLFIAILIVAVGCKKIEKIHSEALVIDTHTDTPMLMVNGDFDISKRHTPPDFRVDIPRLQEGGVDAVFFALFTGQKERTDENYNDVYNLAHQMLDSTIVNIARNPEKAELAKSSSDIEEISKKGKTAICLGMENGFPIAKDIDRVDEFYNLGVRYITLSHSSNNDICDSSTDPVGPEHNGVSEFGEEVIARMNQVGMIIDVSHISDDSFFDVIKLSKAPVIASHSSVRSLCNHPRNLSDEMIKQLAQNGGVIQICILGMYIREADTTSINYIKREELRKKYHNWQYANDEERKAAWAEYDSINRVFPVELPTVAEAVDHVDYVVKLAGVDHVGIGSDFDGGGGLADCRDVSEFPEITRELVKRGYSSKDIEKIWGGNFIRVFKAVEAVAAKSN